MVVSGAPMTEDNHAEKVCDMALDMVDAITDLKDPSTGTFLFDITLQCYILKLVKKCPFHNHSKFPDSKRILFLAIIYQQW